MSPSFPSSRPTIAINFKFLFATFFGWTSWILWPDTVEWWGLGLLSILAALVAFRLAIDAIKLMWRSYRQEKIIAEYLGQGIRTKSSEVASNHQLQDAGMR